MLVLESKNLTGLQSIADALNKQAPKLQASVTDNGLHVNNELTDNELIAGIAIAAYVLRD